MPEDANVAIAAELQHIPSIKLFPVDPISTAKQEGKFIENNRILKNEHKFTYQNINGLNHQGMKQLERIKMTLESQLPDEIKYVLNLLIVLSNNNPAKISLKGEYAFLTDYLLEYLQSQDMDLDFKIDCVLIIRNLVQDVDNCHVMSLNLKLREIILSFLSIYDNTIKHLDFFENDQYTELIKYSLDIIENISSYLSPITADDLIFNQLIHIFKLNNDKNISITILRSISRYLYGTTPNTETSDNGANIAETIRDNTDGSILIDDEFLNKTLGFLILANNNNSIDDEIILTSLDFLIQFLSIKEENLVFLINRDLNRKLILEKILSMLMIYKQNFKTEFNTQNLNYLRLYKRVIKSNQFNTILPVIETSDPIFTELNNLKEPQRATSWLRSTFKPNKFAHITQIELWRAYERQFESNKLLPAVEFIKNVQFAFPQSKAKVIQLPNNEGRKFIIEGIEPRKEIASLERGKNEALINYNNELVNSPSNDYKPELTQSEQVEMEKFNYGFNDYLELNEINISTCLLIKEILKYNLGVDMLKNYKFEFVQNCIYVPDLLNYIYDDIIDAL
jgi:chromatin structure-remodeling complex subunit RSC9